METSLIFNKFDDNNSIIEITPSNNALANQIYTHIYQSLSYENEKAKYSWEYEAGFTDAIEYVFNKKTKTIPMGLLPKTVKLLKEKFKDIKIGVSSEIREIYSNPNPELTKEKLLEYIKTLDLPKNKTPYDHQLNLVLRAINGRRISLLSCTSSGKSLAIYIITRYLKEIENKSVLVVTPSSGLVLQLFSDFHEEYDWKEATETCTLIYAESTTKEMERPVTISTWQSLQFKDPEHFDRYGAVIVDEAHSTRGPVLREVLDKCKKANNFKIGVSGTLPDDGLDSAWIEGSIGRKEIIVRLHELITLGILPPIEICAIEIPYEETIRKYICRQKYPDEFQLIINNGSRKKLVDILINSKKIDLCHNTLILFKNKTTLNEMHNYLTEKYPQFKHHVIIGEVSPKNREVIRRQLEGNTGNIILATYGTMKQGVNIPLLHNLLFAEFSKSMYEIVQAIGRIARRHVNKLKSVVFDPFDNCSYMTKPRKRSFPTLMTNYSVRHYNTRNTYYVDEKLPVTQFSLEGIYEATVYPDDLLEKKEAAKNVALEKEKRKKKKPIKNIPDQFV